MPECFEDAVREVTRELTELLIKKQKDYGPQNVMEFGEFGVLIRANDKMARLKNLLKSGTVPLNESIEDSWRDLSNYGIIALLVRRQWFTLPLKEDKAAPVADNGSN
jgi:hypothetical protein